MNLHMELNVSEVSEVLVADTAVIGLRALLFVGFVNLLQLVEFNAFDDMRKCMLGLIILQK